MTRKTDIDGLSQLTGLQFRTAQANMAGILKRESDLRQNLEQLIMRRNAQAAALRHPAEAALVAGADIRWLQWVDQRRAVISAELAQVLALKDQYRATLKQAVGRDQAAQTLSRKARATEAIKQQRQMYYES